ncbi:MAG TPA: hypothetical protein QGF58_11745 [Myxococcota bacterium]|nr:hypothetical protein [Myxococcota bacterium]
MITLMLLAIVACGGDTPATETPATPPSAEAHGDATVPGSHSDWCPEHAVPESQCTRCDASLVPAFQATGDWCAEHSLPESQCLQCNPELKIERPPEGS